MSDTVMPKIVFKSSSSEGNSQTMAESLPCRIDFTGPAAVESYFQIEDLKSEDGCSYASTFRGRLMFGHKASFPENYKFYVAKQQRGNDSAQQTYQLSDCGFQLRLWDLGSEACPRQDSQVQRSINFLRVADDFAQSDDDDEN